MHHLIEVIQAILDLLSLPFTGRREKGKPRSQLDAAQRVVLLITFGMFIGVFAVIALAKVFRTQ